MDTSEEIYPCSDCKETFPSMVSFKQHETYCIPIKPFIRTATHQICNIDGCRKYHSIDYLPIHRRLFHETTIAEDLKIPPTATAAEPSSSVKHLTLAIQSVIAGLPRKSRRESRSSVLSLIPDNVMRKGGKPLASAFGNRRPRKHYVKKKSRVHSQTTLTDCEISDHAGLSCFLSYMQEQRNFVQTTLEMAISEHKLISYNFAVHVTFKPNRSKLNTSPLISKHIVVQNTSEISDTIDVHIELLQQFKEVRKSLIQKINKLEINIEKLTPRTGSFLPLPNGISESQAVINVRNKDNYCFKWALINFLFWRSKSGYTRTDVDVYDLEDITSDHIYYRGITLDFSGLDFPLEVRQCRIFEKQNRHISVNVFGVQSVNDGIWNILCGPLYRTRMEKYFHVNLLYLEDAQQNKSHYAYIWKLDKLLEKFSLRSYVCNFCLRQFGYKKEFKQHKSDIRNCIEPLILC